jgi:membrane protease YdiL (CAAX protease family)
MSMRTSGGLPAPMLSEGFSPAPPAGGQGNSLDPAPPASSTLRTIFMGPNGPRAGWRLAIFLVLFFALVALASVAARHFVHGQQQAGPASGPLETILQEGVAVALLLFVTFVMTKIEKRTLADYGLPWRNAFRGRFWEGMLWGFAALTTLLLVLRATGDYSFGAPAIHGRQIAAYGAAWGAAFLLVGFFEESLVRGYPQFTLTTGMGFWPSAILLSAVFGSGHLSNPGETWLGGLNAGLFGFLLCLLLRRTGNLWLPIGFHCSWDWGESFFYGVPDSGFVSPGHFLSSSFQGSKWITGGTVGPEGSALCVALLLVLWVLFSFRFREARYPNPAALGDPRRRPS